MTGNGVAEGMIAKTHGDGTVKRENQQQLAVTKWAEKGSEVEMAEGRR